MKMRLSLCAFLVGFVVVGCAHHRAPAPQPVSGQTSSTSTSTSPPPTPIITPDTSLAAKVVRYNSTGRFVVLSFPIGRMPQAGQTLFLYRAGMKVGEVKITGPQRDNDSVADLTTGEAQAGDDVREQ